MTLTEALVALRKAGRLRNQWLPGMLLSRYPLDPDEEEYVVRYDGIAPIGRDRMHPVFGDPATVGCLLALLREATGEPGAYTAPSPTTSEVDHWECHTGNASFLEPTEGEAIVAALIALVAAHVGSPR